MKRSIRDRVAAIDWSSAGVALDDVGIALIGPLLEPDECGALRDLYEQTSRFRSTIDMARYRFGEGQYRYFDRPLPEMVAAWRNEFWPHLLPIAREWAARRDGETPWPDDFDAWIDLCRAAG